MVCFTPNKARQVRHGVARRGLAGCGRVWYGEAGAARPGKVWLVWRGPVRQVRYGGAGLGEARHGRARHRKMGGRNVGRP